MSKGLIAYFAENRVAAHLLMMFIIIGGLYTANQLPVQNVPKLDLRTITVIIPSPGSTPKEIEEDINRRVEESVLGLSGVDRVISEAKQGFGKITIQLETFADPDVVLNDVTNSIDAINRFPPPSAEKPEITLIKRKVDVLTLAISSELATENELRIAAEEVQHELLELPEISQQVELKGIRDREITIELNDEELRRYNLSFAEIASKINRDSINLSFGELNTDSGAIVLHSISKRTTGEEFENIPIIKKLNGSVITLGQIATVTDGFADYEIHSELSGIPTVFANVTAEESQSIDEIRESVLSWLAKKSFPEHIKVAIWNDRAGFTLEQMGRHISNSLIGLVIVFICLVAIFDLRLATWITVGIPLSFIGALLLFPTIDLTVNLSTVFAFFLMIGIVVDDAVVVGENIAVRRQSDKNALEAAISGAKEVAWPITIGAITTVIAFIPFLFITAERYQILNAVPYVVFLVLLVSLVEALFILPAHLSKEKPWSRSPLRDLQARVRLSLDNFRSRVIAPIVSLCVRHTVLTPIVSAIVVIVSFLLIGSDAVRVILIDQSRYVSGKIAAEIKMPVGTHFADTLVEAKRIARAAELTDEQFEGDPIKSISIVVGVPIKSVQSIGRHGDQSSGNSHIASVHVNLNDPPLRKFSVPEFERTWRENIGLTPPIERLEFQSSTFPLIFNVAYSLRHSDREVLKSATADFREMLETEPGIYGLTDNMSLGKRHIKVDLNPEGVLAGITPAGLGAQLRASFHGLEVQRIQRKRDEIKVVIRYPQDQRDNLSAFTTERIRTSSGRETPLSEIAEISETRELAILNRINGENAAFVQGFADVATVAPIKLRRKISDTYITNLLEKYPDLTVKIDGGIRNEIKMFKVLAIVVPLALLAMYALVAAFLRSYWKPLIVVFGIPIALSGSIFSHWILGWDFTTMSIFGVVGVSGVIVNDALVLLDRYNTMRKANPDVAAIAIASGAMHHRFRAVFLTSLTTILGLSPLLYERSEALLNMVPFVVSMIGGLIFAGLFTLFILPTLVMLIEGRRE